ncbi:MAG: hypothetical protein ABMA13_22850, partial [Chthoniobacteraceae bacterium]
MKAALLLLLLASALHAQSIVMKDGRVIATKAMRRQGDSIVATVELPGGDPRKTGELGFPLAQIAKLDFPEPPQLRTAPDLITRGKAADAIAQIDPVVKFYEAFRDAPGSWWAEAAILKAQALAALGRDAEAAPIVEQVARIATDPETQRAAEVQLAAGLVKKGNHTRALEIAQRALKEATRPAVRAAAGVIKGECLLAAQQWDAAVLAFLQVPVFFPGEKVLLPQSMLGAARAQFGMDDLPRARATLDELLAAIELHDPRQLNAVFDRGLDAAATVRER